MFPVDRIVVIHTIRLSAKNSTALHFHWSLYYRSLSRPYRNSTKRCPKCCSYSFVAVIAPRSASATGPKHPTEIYIYEKPPRRLALCAVTLLLLLPNNTMPEQFPITFSPEPSQTSQSIVDATAMTRSRSSTMITTLEKEFGMEPPKSAPSGLLYTLRLLILKRKKSTSQAPEPRRRPSFYEGSWVTLWDRDVDDANLPQSPLEDIGFPQGSFPDYHASGEQDSEVGQDVATPTSGTAWNSDESDEELTPLFSSNFPRTPIPNALRGEGHPDGDPGNQRPKSHQA